MAWVAPAMSAIGWTSSHGRPRSAWSRRLARCRLAAFLVCADRVAYAVSNSRAWRLATSAPKSTFARTATL
jgi:hypothetical protein